MVAALDLALSQTGIARGDGTLVTVRGAGAGYERHWYIASTVLNHVHGADVVILEGYGFARPHTLAALAELGGVIRTTLHKHGYPLVVIPPSSLKLFAVGKGNATKDVMLEAAKLITGGLPSPMRPSNHDEADAYWLRRAGLWRYEHGVTPKGLEAVKWPDLEAAS